MIDRLSDDSSKDDVKMKILNASLSKVVHVHVRVWAVFRHLDVVHTLRPQVRGHELVRPRREVVAHVLTLPFVRDVDVVGGSREANREDDEAGDYEIRPRRSRPANLTVLLVIVPVPAILNVGARVLAALSASADLPGHASADSLPFARVLRRGIGSASDSGSKAEMASSTSTRHAPAPPKHAASHVQ